MARDTLPMDKIFTACRDVLDDKLTPIHYAKLTSMALRRLGLTDKDVNWQRQIEDVREKMLQAGQYDTFYTGAPHCLAGLKWWFQSQQLRMFHPSSGIIIEGSASSGADGAFNALMRDPYLKIKTLAPKERINRARSNGFVLEKHVADWFQRQWPKFYRCPDNERKWTEWCDHDFKLEVDGSVYEVDVSGPKLNGTFGNPGKGKRRTDMHLLCQIIDRDVVWSSVVTGQNYNQIISSEQGHIWPERLAVWLNCRHQGIDYKAVRDFLTNPSMVDIAA